MNMGEPTRTILNEADAGIPHWGHTYFMVNDDDTTADLPAGVAVKIGASHALERRQRSFPNPIDLDASFVVRFANWDGAYAFEQFLHARPGIADKRWPEFLTLNDYWESKRKREGEAGRYEWFRIDALETVKQVLRDPAMKKLFGWSDIIHASDVMLYKKRPDISAQRAAFGVAQEIVAQLISCGACRLTAFQETPVNDRYAALLAAPDNLVTVKLVQEGQQLVLPFFDGRGVRVFGQTMRLQGQLLVPLPFMAPNAVERGREGQHMKLVRAMMQAPTAGTVKPHIQRTVANFVGLSGARVNGELPINMPSARRLIAPQPPLLLSEDDAPLLSPASKGETARPTPLAKAVSDKPPGLFDEPQ